MEQAKALQEDFSNYLKTIRRGKNTEKKKKTFSNINRFFNGRNDSIKFVEDYGSMILEAKNKAATKGERLKILTPKQDYQKLLHK